MSTINAAGQYFIELNELVRACSDKNIIIENVNGQRYVGAAAPAGTEIIINGTPGNAVGAYLDGATIDIRGNAQDAAGDTMNDGLIVIHGSAGDGAGYAMRGGSIYIQGDVGYRAGIHMKEYKGKVPVIVVGGSAGSFLGEYQAGGVIVVLGIGCENPAPVGNFCGTGMHGGVMYLRCAEAPKYLPPQVEAAAADPMEAQAYVKEYTDYFGGDTAELMRGAWFKLTPNTKNPYKQLYTHM